MGNLPQGGPIIGGPLGISVLDSSSESTFLWGCTVRHSDTARRGDQELVAEDPNRSHLRVDPLPFGGTEGCPGALVRTGSMVNGSVGLP